MFIEFTQVRLPGMDLATRIGPHVDEPSGAWKTGRAGTSQEALRLQ
jgi:hypothetical protein